METAFQLADKVMPITPARFLFAGETIKAWKRKMPEDRLRPPWHAKISQDNKRSVWKYVPIRNFRSESDMDWSNGDGN